MLFGADVDPAGRFVGEQHAGASYTPLATTASAGCRRTGGRPARTPGQVDRDGAARPAAFRRCGRPADRAPAPKSDARCCLGGQAATSPSALRSSATITIPRCRRPGRCEGRAVRPCRRRPSAAGVAPAIARSTASPDPTRPPCRGSRRSHLQVHVRHGAGHDEPLRPAAGCGSPARRTDRAGLSAFASARTAVVGCDLRRTNSGFVQRVRAARYAYRRRRGRQ